jgi:aminoglycoside phosphotransferase (APT) family kinase protein
MSRPPAPQRMPPAEHAIDSALVRVLLAEQHPDLAQLPIRPVTHGWDNVMFRLGEDLAVRLPRRAIAAELMANEQRWLPEHAARVPVPTPAPVRVGAPGCGYPWPWSVTPWLRGLPAERAPLRADQAQRLGAFLHALHRPAPADAPFNPARSIALAKRAETTDPMIARVAAARPDLVTVSVRRAWDEAVAADIDTGPVWIHGDLHARNVLSDKGVLSGIIDWGDTARGDPATDLYGLWMLFPDPQARAAALAAYGGISAATARRARGWAVAIGVVLIEVGSAGDPGLLAMGEWTLRALGEAP